MSFSSENEMYPIIEKWLNTRERDPCHQVVIDRYRFDTGKSFRADLVGVYLREENHRFVGIEAKLNPPFSLQPLGQAQAMQTFCHEVYLALPYEIFHGLDERKKEILLSLLSNHRMGLLLVRPEFEKPSVIEEVKVYPLPFRLDLYKEAVGEFSDVSEETGEEIASQLEKALGDLIEGCWSCYVENATTTLFQTDVHYPNKEEITSSYDGKIVFDDDKSVLVTRDIWASEFIKTSFSLEEENKKELSEIVKEHLKRLRDVNDELDFTYEPEPWLGFHNGTKVDISFLEDKLAIYYITAMLREMDEDTLLSLNIRIERPPLVNVKDKESLMKFCSELRDAYLWIAQLAQELIS